MNRELSLKKLTQSLEKILGKCCYYYCCCCFHNEYLGVNKNFITLDFYKCIPKSYPISEFSRVTATAKATFQLMILRNDDCVSF